MTALQVAEKDVLRDTMIQHTPLTDVVGAGDSAKIVWEWMTEDGEDTYPYIKMIRMSGGSANDAKESNDSDAMWKIVGVTSSLLEAQTLANVVYDSLHDVMPYTDNVASVECYAEIEEIMPIFDSYKVNNIPIYEVGGLFRLRLILN